jgi:hypothetical protein
VDLGAVANPSTVGFRFKYVSQGSGIADGISAPKDVTWLPLPSVIASKNLPFFEIARVLLRFDHVACVIVNADDGIM